MSATTHSSTANRLVDFLGRPDSYPERVEEVRLVETHISWVFLTERHAYKLKKPVRFEFVDYSTLEARERACRDEVRLNRRLAEDVYLAVEPITRGRGGRLRLGGEGKPVDWVVKMRRLPEACNLDHMIRHGRLDLAAVREVASLLAAFFVTSAPLTLRADDYCRQIGEHVRSNRTDLADVDPATPLVDRIHAAQLRFLRLRSDLLDRRVRDGRIVDGHGDLRPEHIYLKGRPRVIDCVEFSPQLRQLDVADELAFLAMECERLGAAWVGDEVMRHYVQTSRDQPPAELVDFYKSYRACVRAKVLSLRAKQLPENGRLRSSEAVLAYLRIADRYARSLGPPLVLVMSGVSGSGKSTLAAQAAESLSMRLLQTDAIRRERWETAAERSAGPGPRGQGYGRSHAAHAGRSPNRKVTAETLAYGEGPYRPEQRERVYETMFQRAEAALRDGLSVVLDGAFLSNALRYKAIELAGRYGAQPLLVHCQCPPEVAQRRISQRLAEGPTHSDARPAFVARQRQEEEPIPADLPAITIDTTASLPLQVEQVIARCSSAVMR